MPMEHIRQKLMQNPDFYPEMVGMRKNTEAISIASSTSSTSSTLPSKPPPTKSTIKPQNKTLKRSTVIISSDEEDGSTDEEDSEVVELSAGKYKKPAQTNPAPLQNRIENMFQRQGQSETDSHDRYPWTQGGPIKPKAAPIAIPSNRNLYPPGPSQRPMLSPGLDGELVNSPDVGDDRPYMTPAETERALKELMGGAMNQELDKDIEIDMTQAKVQGFKEGIELLPHQILGRAWMKDREDLTKKRTGGILADDMGLGKTIQTLTRIVEGKAKKKDKEDGWSATTLVVCPLALVGQWADEIKKMTNLTVITHQGTQRTSDPAILQKYFVVVTTYDTVKSEYMAYSPSAKDESKASSKSSSKKITPQVSDDESDEDFGKTVIKKTASKAKAKKCALYGVKWWRIVLDEAHNIKNVKTKGATACCELQGKFRWCLTGTPMQNSVTELYSLIKFLRIKPLSDWVTFNDTIAKPVSSGRGASRAMKRLQVVLKQIMLRRRKDQYLNGKVLIELPKRTVEIVTCDFDEEEREFYVSLETQMESVIKKLMQSNKGGSNYMSVLLLLLRLRQACNHPSLVTKDYKDDSEALQPKAVEKGKDDKDVDPDDELVAAFGQLGVTRKCQMCITELNSNNMGEGEWRTHCRDCVPLAIKAKKVEGQRPSSAKIRMVLKILRNIDLRSDSAEKTIIFSQFTSMLDLLEPFLREKGIKYVRYDGRMNPREREASLDKIKNDSSIRVILISFKAGSTGLNLTACNNVILVDLWWNPALEDQAFDRAHRFGQKRDVNIFKLKIDNTVEDRILLLQDKKRALAAAALSGDKLKNMNLGWEDLLALFRHAGRDSDSDSD